MEIKRPYYTQKKQLNGRFVHCPIYSIKTFERMPMYARLFDIIQVADKLFIDRSLDSDIANAIYHMRYKQKLSIDEIKEKGLLYDSTLNYFILKYPYIHQDGIKKW